MSLEGRNPRLLKFVRRTPLSMGGELRLLISTRGLPVRPTLLSVDLKLLGFTGNHSAFLGLF